jgi:CRISPR/Cas system-associated exonuclease Cas4 (RecB family)
MEPRPPLLDADTWLNPDDDASDRVQSLLDALTSEQFEYWYREWQYRKNIQDGNPHYNKTGYVPDPERHSPSQLLQCKRKKYYRSYNAPEESADPSGIFWTGERYEEEIAMPFLMELAESVNENNYVQNSMWVNFSIDVGGDVGEIQIRGETDPVIVDRRGNPLIVTEVKNKKSLNKFDRDNPEPDKHHKAQLHAYMYGLSKSFDRTVRQGVILYGSRQTHDLLPVIVDFDLEFWEDTVVHWAKEQSHYRLDRALPPISPEFSWECKFCDYAKRCGMGDNPPFYDGPEDNYPGDPEWRDVEADGFLPLTEYPIDNVIEYLRAHGPKGAKLTPTLAAKYPMLTEKFNVHDWTCTGCDETWEIWRFDWDGNTSNPPNCTECGSSLRGPAPKDQHEE